jgi:ribosomal protein S19
LAKNDLTNALMHFKNAIQLARQAKTEVEKETARRAVLPALLGQVIMVHQQTVTPTC